MLTSMAAEGTEHTGDGAGTSDDRIRLVLPADPAYGRIARIAVSSVALRLGVPYPVVEDLRLAVDEAVILLLRPDAGPDAGPDAVPGSVNEAAVAPSHDRPRVDEPTGDTSTATLTVELVIGPDALSIEVRRQPAGPHDPSTETVEAEAAARRRFEEIVAGTVDHVAVSDDGSTVHLRRAI